MKYTVTQEDIDSAKRQDKYDGTSCPVARCLRRSGAEHPFVTSNRIFMTSAWYMTPLIVSDFVCKFDAFEPVEPFEFELA